MRKLLIMNDPLLFVDSDIDDTDSDPNYVQPSETGSNNSRPRLVNISHSVPSSQNDAEKTTTVLPLPKIIKNTGKNELRIHQSGRETY